MALMTPNEIYLNKQQIATPKTRKMPTKYHNGYDRKVRSFTNILQKQALLVSVPANGVND